MDYQSKNALYFKNIRHDVLNFAKLNKNSEILEIGCGYGDTLIFLKENGFAKKTAGIDIFKNPLNENRYKEIDIMKFGDITTEDIILEDVLFDVIIMADVLEHILEPTIVLNKIKKWLKPNGYIIISMPNIRHFSSFVKIFIKGNFQYQESGIFDKTHLRFYCQSDIERLLIQNEYTILKKSGSVFYMKNSSISSIFNRLTFGVFKEFLSYQYFFKAKIE